MTGLSGEALREEMTCTCGAGHGSLEGHMGWCAYKPVDTPAPIATPEEVAACRVIAMGIVPPWWTFHYPALRVDLIREQIAQALCNERLALSALKDENERVTAALRKANDIIQSAGGTCLGLAMSGSNHPDPDGALMGVFHAAQDFGPIYRAALTPTEPEAKETTNG